MSVGQRSDGRGSEQAVAYNGPPPHILGLGTALKLNIWGGFCMEEVIQREKELVYRLAFSQCHQKDQADDIFQNVMYRYMKRKPVFESLEHEKAWFIRVTLNCSKTSLKSFWHNKVDEIDEQTYIFEKQEIDLTPYLNKLSKKYNVVLYLFYYEGYSTKEMAELLHIKENNVRVLLNRARNQLRKEIEADEK